MGTYDRRLQVPESQSLLKQVRRLEDEGTITGATSICVLLAGEGRASGMSQRMHDAAYGHMGLDIKYIEVATGDLPGAMAEISAIGTRFLGASVTTPHKEDICDYLSYTDPKAQAIGAVNTVVMERYGFHGYNSDWIGALKALRESGVEPGPGTKAVVAGTGGAGMAVAYMLGELGADVTLYAHSRPHREVEEIAGRLGVRYGGRLDSLSSSGGVDIIVNCTLCGSGKAGLGGLTAIPMALLERSAGAAAFDAVFVPTETRFLREASALGLGVVLGISMLIYQGEFQVWKFTHRERLPDGTLDAMKAAALDFRS